jgi:hypothetical protein
MDGYLIGSSTARPPRSQDVGDLSPNLARGPFRIRALRVTAYKNRAVARLLTSAGGGTRTPDTRIMIPLL